MHFNATWITYPTGEYKSINASFEFNGMNIVERSEDGEFTVFHLKK